MITADQSVQIKELLAQANTILVIVGPKATVDHWAAASALVGGLEATGKQVTFLSPIPALTEIEAKLPELPVAQNQLGNRDLSISFEHQIEAVDKVSYHIDEQAHRFYLVIKPQKGSKPLDAQTVEFSYTGAEADLIFLIGVHELEQLDQLYFGYEQLYQDVTTVTFHNFETNIGTVKLNTSGSSSLSEAMALFVQELELPLTSSAATQLLVAVEETTDSFKSLATTADTFEVVAQLLRFGARRLRRQVPTLSTAVMPTASPSLAEAMKSTGGKKTNGKNDKKPGGLDYQPGITVSGK